MTLAALTFVVSVAAGAQDPRAVDDLRAYNALVAAYRSGRDAPVHELLTWDQVRLQRAFTLLGGFRDIEGIWSPERANAAAMLHTDAALRLVTENDAAGGYFHLDTASQLLRRAGTGSRSFASQWYQTVSNALKLRAEAGLVELLLKLGRERAPDDPGVLMASAILLEWEAGFPLGETPTDVGQSVVAERYIRELSKGRLERLRPAEAWLRRILEMDANHDTARLHLGRVYMIRRADRDAQRSFDAIIARGERADRQLLYMAMLFTGGLEERAGRFDTAVRHYERAASTLPHAQTAQLACAGVLQRAGHVDKARAAMAAMLGRPREPEADPWWYYLVDSPTAVDGRLSGLRKAVRR